MRQKMWRRSVTAGPIENTPTATPRESWGPAPLPGKGEPRLCGNDFGIIFVLRGNHKAT